MPTLPYARPICSVNGDTAVPGVRTCVDGGQVITFDGENTAHWISSRYELFSYPVGFPLPAGWTDIGGVYTYLGTAGAPPPPVTLSRSDVRNGKYGLRLTVNDGVKGGVSDPEMVSEELSILVPSPSGDEGTFDGETNQFGDSWQSALERDRARVDARTGHALVTQLTSNATPAVLRTVAFSGNARLHKYEARVVATSDDGAAAAWYEVKIAYQSDGAGVLTQRVSSITTVFETSAGMAVTQALAGNNLEVSVTGVAATNLRWHLLEERYLRLRY
jgi:hypothetical protein